MSEGGHLPWKCQPLDTHRGPTNDYSSVQSPLPNPPKGHTWKCDPDTKEWSIIRVQDYVPTTTTLKSIHVDSENRIQKDGCYITHRVQSTDTLQGLCLKYKVSPTALRQLNHFSGSNLSLAPHTLIVPKDDSSPSSSDQTADGTSPNPTDNDDDSTERNVRRFLQAWKCYNTGLRRAGRADITEFGREEAVYYLDMNDGNVEEAIQEAKDDIGA